MVALAFLPSLLPKGKSTLFVYCGAAISEPMREIGDEFEKRYYTKIDYTFAGSPCLLSQIIFTRKGDLYMPGEYWYMEQALKKNLIKEWKVVAIFEPVIAVQKGNPKGIKSILDLKRQDIRLGLGSPEHCAVGHISDEIFKKAEKVLGMKGLAKEIWDHARYMAMQEPELGNAIKLGHLDATIIWQATAYRIRKEVDVVPIDERYRVDSPIPLGILKFSKNPQIAKQFLEFVSSPTGRAIFKKHGYTLPEEVKK